MPASVTDPQLAYDGTDGTGTPSTGYLATQLNFVLVSGTNSIARGVLPVNAVEGALSLKIDYIGLGSRGDKNVFIYDVGAKAGPWLASNDGNIVSGDDSAPPSINRAGDYQVTLTDANGCTGATTEAFSETDCAKLPVILVSFSALTGEGNVHLEWQTTLETNSNRFEIQRSTDAKRWILAGSLPTREDGTTSLKTYTFLDTSPAPGLNYYRLKMVDNDNTFAYSGIREVRVDGGQKPVTIYPNPAKETLNLIVPAKASVESTRIYDMKGVLVFKGNTAPSSGISLKNLAPGNYVLQILKTNGKSETHVVIVGR